MAAWTNNKATSIPIKQVGPGLLSKPVKPTDLGPGVANAAVKAAEGSQQDAAIQAAQILARELESHPAAGPRSHVTVTMTGTATQPPAIGDTITVTVTLANPQASEIESAVQGRV